MTVVTHTSHSRWKQLRGQCRSWKGPLVASVYIHLEQASGDWLDEQNQKKVQDVILQFQKLHET